MNTKTILIYLKYISLSVIFVAITATSQFYFLMKIPFAVTNYTAPILVAIIFGLLFGKIEILKQKLVQASITDPLTNMHNRRWINEKIESCMSYTARYKKPFAIILIDIDHFKKINDTMGHQVGDIILTEVATIIQSSTRMADYTARWGGEEFLIVLPETDLTGARKHAERIRWAIENNEFSNSIHMTASFGVTQNSEEETSMITLMDKADKALYNAKNNGRNLVETFSEA
ncbi:MAG: GGDEF domain-containing protein [Leptospirales bacterium]